MTQQFQCWYVLQITDEQFLLKQILYASIPTSKTTQMFAIWQIHQQKELM